MGVQAQKTIVTIYMKAGHVLSTAVHVVILKVMVIHPFSRYSIVFLAFKKTILQ